MYVICTWKLYKLYQRNLWSCLSQKFHVFEGSKNGYTWIRGVGTFKILSNTYISWPGTFERNSWMTEPWLALLFLRWNTLHTTLSYSTLSDLMSMAITLSRIDLWAQTFNILTKKSASLVYSTFSTLIRLVAGEWVSYLFMVYFLCIDDRTYLEVYQCFWLI